MVFLALRCYMVLDLADGDSSSIPEESSWTQPAVLPPESPVAASWDWLQKAGVSGFRGYMACKSRSGCKKGLYGSAL